MHSVVAFDGKESEPEILRDKFFCALESENESLGWQRTSVASLEFTGRVSMYASGVDWLLSPRQSPTVARIAAGGGWIV